MDSFEMLRRATILSDTESSYQLARRVVELEAKLKEMQTKQEKKQ